jgi:hypothetical protein
MGEGQMVSGHYVAPHWSEGIAQLAGAYLSKRDLKKADEEEGDLKTRYNAGLQEALQQYSKKSQGTPEVLAGEDGTGGMPAVAGDPRAAIIEAMTSQYEPLQKLGAAEFANLGKGGMSAKDILSLTGYDETAKVKAAQSGNIGDLKRGRKSHVVNGQLVYEGDGEAPTVLGGDFRDKFNAPETMTGPNGEILTQTAKGTGEVKALGGGGVTVNTGDTKAANAFGEAASKASVGNLEKSFESAKAAQKSFEVFSNAASHLGNVKGGTGADVIQGAKKVAQMLGAPLDPSITSMEQVKAALGQAVMDNAKTLGTGNGFTDSDRKFLTDLTFGNLNLDEATLKRAVDLGLASSVNTLKSHDKLIQKLGSVPGSNPEMMNSFAVGTPEFSLDADRFHFDPKTERFLVKTSTGQGASPLVGQGQPAKQAQPQLHPDPKKNARMLELQQLLQGGQ